MENGQTFLNQTEVTTGDSGCWPLRCHAAAALNSTNSGKKRNFIYGCPSLGAGGYHTDGPEYEKVQSLLCNKYEKEPLDGVLLEPPENPETESAEMKTFRESFNQLGVAMGVHGHRRKIHYNSSGAIVFAKLPLDFANSKLPIISGVSVHLQLVKADDNFYMFSEDEEAKNKGFRIKVMEAQLLTPVRKYSAGIALDLERRMQKNNNQINYFFPRIEVKKLSIPKGVQSFMTEDLKSGAQIPERTTLCLMTERQWEGALNLNPLDSKAKFGEDYAVSDIFFSINSMPLRPLGDLFTGGQSCEQFTRAAYLMMQNSLAGPRSYGVDISYEEFKGGNFFFVADFTKPRRAFDSQCLHETNSGSLRLDIKFEAPTKQVLNVFCYPNSPLL